MNHQLDKLFQIILDASEDDGKVQKLMSFSFSHVCQTHISFQSESVGIRESSYRAFTTLAFVSPDTVLPRIMEQLRTDLNSDVKALSDTDVDIWRAPEGTPFIDGKSRRILFPPC